MASNDPGYATMPVVEDAKEINSKAKNGLEEDRPAAPDQFDPAYETSRWEIYAYYAYYIGNNGLTLFNFAPTAFQNLLSQAAGESGILFFAGRNRTINSIVLLSNGVSFAIQVVLFLIIGSYAVIAYQTTLTFWTAAFPGLARNTAQLRAKAEEYNEGVISRDQYDTADMLARSRIANVAFYVQSCGEIIILAIIVGILHSINVEASEANNNWGLSVLIAFATGVWLLLSIPWFVLEKRRPGQPIPPNMNIVAVGIWQLYRAIRKIWQLKQSLLYLIGYFLLGDSLNTTVTVVATLQNTIVEYDTLTLTYLLLVGIAAQAYSYSQIMVSEVTPRGKEFLFFSLFSIIGKTSSFIGPIVSSTIIDASPNDNTSTPFYFLFSLSLGSFLLLFLGVDLKKSRREQEKFLEDERILREKLAQGSASFAS
ncbi:MAG: hypothetical protein Q9167_000633 [Letrouitia subvulpina]